MKHPIYADFDYTIEVQNIGNTSGGSINTFKWDISQKAYKLPSRSLSCAAQTINVYNIDPVTSLRTIVFNTYQFPVYTESFEFIIPAGNYEVEYQIRFCGSNIPSNTTEFSKYVIIP